MDIVTNEMRRLPGPGEYDSPQKEFGQGVQSVTIRGRPEDIKRDKSPGPGKYDPTDSIVKASVLTYKMPQSARGNIISKEDLQKPGPGSYPQSQQFGSAAKSFQLRGRPDEKIGN